MFLLGAAAVGFFLTKRQAALLQDATYLEKRLEALKKDDAPKGPGRQPASVRVAEAVWGKIGTISDYPGRLHAIRDATVSSEVGGLIRSIPIEPGMKLEGEKTLIAQIDRTWLDLQLQENDAEIGSLEADLAHQQAELDRIIPLAETRAVSASDLSLQQSKVDKLQQDLRRLKAARSAIEERLKRTTILAPFDGYVIKRSSELGELVSPGTPIAHIISLGQVDAIVHVVESHVVRIKVGDHFPIFVKELDHTVDGTVHEIVPYGPTASRPYPVFVRLDDENGKLKPGMTVVAYIPATDPVEGIVVSKDAVLDRPDGATVWVVRDPPGAAESVSDKSGPADAATASPSRPTGIVQPVPVTIAANAIDTLSVIPETAEGRELLKPGVKTVIEGAERLTPGQTVQIVTINPEVLKGLPPRSGQTRIQTKVSDATKPE